MSMDELPLKKAGDDAALMTDPPILVGGGGSTYVWVRLDMGSDVVDPTSDHPVAGIKAGSKKPKHRERFSCSRNSHTPKYVVFCNGLDQEEVFAIKNPNKWYLRCSDEEY
jgi:hypothetical protein